MNRAAVGLEASLRHALIHATLFPVSAQHDQPKRAFIDQIIDGDLEMGEGLKKIKDMIVAHDKLTGASEPADPVPEEDGAGSKDGKDSVTKESIAAIVKDAVATAIKESGAQSRPTITRVKSSAPGATQTQESAAPKSADEFVRMIRN